MPSPPASLGLYNCYQKIMGDKFPITLTPPHSHTTPLYPCNVTSPFTAILLPFHHCIAILLSNILHSLSTACIHNVSLLSLKVTIPLPCLSVTSLCSLLQSFIIMHSPYIIVLSLCCLSKTPTAMLLLYTLVILLCCLPLPS